MILLRAAAVLSLASVALAGDRVEVSLNGMWEYQRADSLDAPPGGGPWKPFEVPGYLSGFDYQRAWFRRSFDVPAAMRGKRVKLRCGGVKFNSRVYVNGRHVGGCFGGYRPFEVDVTDAVRFDKSNELHVGVHDWTGVFSDGERVEFDDPADWHRVRATPRDRILAPIGGLYQFYGIWDDVTLAAHDAVYVKDLFIRPSVRRGELAVDFTLANESGSDAEVQLQALVQQAGQGDDAEPALSLPGATVRIPAGATRQVTLQRAWPDVRPWSHLDPHLHRLRSELSTGDVRHDRFGFREFWTEGHKFVLNGTPINLLMTASWPPREPMSREAIRERWEAVKRAGCVAFRTHTQPWRRIHYEVADEVGLLIVVEGAVWNDDTVYRVFDPAFWDNYGAHLAAMVRRDKNHPSVVMWSLENEFYGSRLNDDSPAKADLVRMGELVKREDPTRPITFSSDGDPGGVADVIGLHYPHEYPRFTCWPNEALWLSTPQPIQHPLFGDGLLDDEGNFFWRKHKPLYIGEFLWLPCFDPSWHTVFFGDEAYRNYPEYRNRGKAEAWKMQIIGYRHHEVAGISPWTMIEGGPLDKSNHLYRAHQYAYQPLAAYCLDYDSRFYSEEQVTRRVVVLSDAFADVELSLQWQLTFGPEVLDEGSRELTLPAAGQRLLTLPIAMPEATQRTPVTWRVCLKRDGRTVFEEEHNYSVFPRQALRVPFGASLAVYDPSGETLKLFGDAGGRGPRVVGAIDGDLPEVDLLVIGAGALDAQTAAGPRVGEVHPARAAITSFTERGGRVLVLRQTADPAGVFDTGLASHCSTMTFPAMTEHPVLAGLTPDDLKFWRGDHVVSDLEPVRPLAGDWRPLIVAGSETGLDTAPLLERASGSGAIVYCQMKLVEKFHAEPAAAKLLQSLLDYLVHFWAGREPAVRKTALIGGDEAYRDRLMAMGLRLDDLSAQSRSAGQASEGTGGPSVARAMDFQSAARELQPAQPATARREQEHPCPTLQDYDVLIVRGGVPDPAAIKAMLDRGGRVLVHRAPADDIARLAAVLGSDLALVPFDGSVNRAEEIVPRLPVLREDVYWLGPRRHWGHGPAPRDEDMTDGVFTKTLDGKAVTEHDVTDWKLSGQIVERRGPVVTFATNGAAAGTIDFPHDGWHVIGVRARGTPVEGVYPHCEIRVAGQPAGVICLTDGQWRTYTTLARAAKGPQKVSVAFINDLNTADEDRNLQVDRVYVAPDLRQSFGAAEFVTMPYATAVIQHGAGMLVLDQLKWDEQPHSSKRATRYALSLLAVLDADFPLRNVTSIRCADMEPEPGLQHYHNAGSHVVLGTNGFIRTEIDVARAGWYALELVARGTQAEDVYPEVQIRIDGKAATEVQLSGAGWRTYLCRVKLEAGKRELSLAFTNDKHIPGVADRNLWLDEVRLSPE
jgi:hypothetical protein